MEEAIRMEAGEGTSIAYKVSGRKGEVERENRSVGRRGNVCIRARIRMPKRR